MSSFVFNVSDTLNDISNSKNKIKNYEDSMNIYLNSTSNFDSVWNDYNTANFINFVKKDQKYFNEQIETLTSYLNIIEDFCDSLKKIIYSKFRLNLTAIKYDLDKLNKLISILNSCYQKINQNYEILDNLQVPITFKYYFLLQKYKNDTLEYRNNIFNVRKKLLELRNEVENLIIRTKSNINRFDVTLISNNTLDYNYTVISTKLIKSE